jgi:Na+-translocating ferredoxin:NAD+ oxidoreductase subunit B
MTWLTLLAALLIASGASFGASFLSFAWKKRKRPAEGARGGASAAAAIEALLPGHDCGLCGESDCRSYASAVDSEGADPALCSPGGAELEDSLRSLLASRAGTDPRARAARAVVRCGGGSAAAERDYPYEGRRDCASASLLFGGPNSCKEGCVGLGSCATACPLGAIAVRGGLAEVLPERCTGCGACVRACPKGLISLVPSSAEWYVACSSARSAETKKKYCRAACIACGECARLSSRFEFSLQGELARENTSVAEGGWEDIASSCPTGAILRAGSEKRLRSSFRKPGR